MKEKDSIERIDDLNKINKKNWSIFEAEKPNFSKRCFFNGLKTVKPAYILNSQPGKTVLSNETWKEGSSSNNDGVTLIKKKHLGPERYENTFKKIFSGSAELMGDGAEDTNDQNESDFLNSRTKIQHPSRMVENLQTKYRLLLGVMESEERNKEMENIKKNLEAQLNLDVLKKQRYKLEKIRTECIEKLKKQADQMKEEDKVVKKKIDKNFVESSYWKTEFRSQIVEPGILLSDKKKELYNKLPARVLTKNLPNPSPKPYYSEVDDNKPSQTLEVVVPKIREEKVHHFSKSNNWKMMGETDIYNLEATRGNKSDESIISVPEDVKGTKRMLMEISSRSKTEEKREIYKKGRNRDRRSESCWFRNNRLARFEQKNENE